MGSGADGCKRDKKESYVSFEERFVAGGLLPNMISVVDSKFNKVTRNCEPGHD
jgi:hypothetical protein